ncbi:MAG: hypothetical protein HY830_15270 [Actinobacteria bacterium]|nr:hypothetical protein [Actinomycetota bacterium]
MVIDPAGMVALNIAVTAGARVDVAEDLGGELVEPAQSMGTAGIATLDRRSD